MKPCTIITDVSHGGTAFDGLPFDAMRIELPEEYIARIRRLAAVVADLGVYKIVEFDYRAVPMKIDYDQEGEPLFEAEEDEYGFGIRTECDCMNVTKYGVFWSGYLKNTDIRWETSLIPFEMLKPGATIDLRE